MYLGEKGDGSGRGIFLSESSEFFDKFEKYDKT